MGAGPLIRRGGSVGSAVRLLAFSWLALACSGGDVTGPVPATADPPVGSTDDVAIFHDRARESGLDFVHLNGATGKRYIAEIMGGGAALIDYDDDGDLDLYLVQSGPLPADPAASPGDRLYRNDLVSDGSDGRLRFTDVSDEAGLQAGDYGMGVASGDFDGDGRIDLYVTRLGTNALLRNVGDGRFEDVTHETGTDDARFSIPAVFLDYDRDGLLDLFVGNYIDFRTTNHRNCPAPSGAPDYCGPLAYRAEPDRLFRNLGGGRFEDATVAAGLGDSRTNALGAVPADFDGDGWVDLYVASDGTANQLWINNRDGTFTDRALLAGCALNAEGQPEASMGVDAEDFDGDGDIDLFMTHLREETNTIYVNRGDGNFEDRTTSSGLGPPSRGHTGFGTGWFDYDNDGDLDLLTVNGAVYLIQELVDRGDPFPLHQPNQLFRNRGNGRFDDVTAEAGPVFELSEVSRGAAFGDVDNDGDTDVMIVNNGGPVRLLINERGASAHWLGLRLLDESGASAGGSRVGLRQGAGRTVWRRAGSSGSYASANDPRVLFGLGSSTAVEAIVVVWPDGSREEFASPAPDAYATLRKGAGEETRAGIGEPGPR